MAVLDEQDMHYMNVRGSYSIVEKSSGKSSRKFLFLTVATRTRRITDTGIVVEKPSPPIIDSGESIFDYEYLREFEAKIAKAFAVM